MYKWALGFFLFSGILIACKDDEKEPKENKDLSKGLPALFKEAKSPYQLTDTALLKNTDTSSLPSATISPFIPDSIKNYFGNNAAIRYTALVKLNQKEKENYLVIKASTRSKTAGLLLVADKENNITASYPFLLPDADANTTQVSTIDKNFTVTKTIIRREGADIIGEGKEVLAYDPATKAFSIIMMDALDDNPAVMRNPIDTFPKTNKLAGDYLLNKKNMVAVRDGRRPNQLLVFIHTENNEGDCIGQMKGEFLMTASTTATYRQGGDPCVLNLVFKGNTVSINEETGCGNYRGLDCQLSGTFTRKKAQPLKQTSIKPKRK